MSTGNDFAPSRCLDEYAHGALRAGAREFLLKDAGPELLVQAVHAGAVGDAPVAPNITRLLLSTLAVREPAKDVPNRSIRSPTA